jgi:hypothetical protein
MGKEKYENLGCAGKSGFESGDQTVKLINRGDIFVDTKRKCTNVYIGNDRTAIIVIPMNISIAPKLKLITIKGKRYKIHGLSFLTTAINIKSNVR